ncbi:MAG: HU family DNA-binding protein [Pseudomonadota bacterium]
MNRSELVDAVAEEASLTKVDATKALDAVIKSISQAMQTGEQVALMGFGTFVVKDRGPRTVRNPRTGESMDVPASRVPAFKPSKNLKQLVDSN